MRSLKRNALEVLNGNALKRRRDSQTQCLNAKGRLLVRMRSAEIIEDTEDYPFYCQASLSLASMLGERSGSYFIWYSFRSRRVAAYLAVR